MKRVMVDCNTCNTENFGIDNSPFCLYIQVIKKVLLFINSVHGKRD